MKWSVLLAEGGAFLSNDRFYTITVAACGAGIQTCALVTATPVPGTIQATANEPNLSLNSRGEKTGPWSSRDIGSTAGY